MGRTPRRRWFCSALRGEEKTHGWCRIEATISTKLKLVRHFTFLLWLLAHFVLDDLALELPDWHVGDHILELLCGPACDLVRLILISSEEPERRRIS